MTQKLRWRTAASFLIAALAVGLARAQFVPIVDLKVVNGAAFERTQEPVSIGVPVSKDIPIYQPYGVRVATLGGALVPAQFKVLTRWGGARDDATKPIRWLSVTFKADVAPNATQIYKLVLAPGTTVPGGLWASQNMWDITVWTAPDTWFKVDRLVCTLFKEAVIDGQSVLGGPGSLELKYADGTTPTPFVTSTELEEYQGYLSTRCVIRQKGWIGPLAFTTRYTFLAGRKDVVVDFRLENPAAYGLFSTSIPDGQKYFDRCYFHLPIGGSSHTAVSSYGSYSLSGGAEYKLDQTFAWTSNALDALAGFSYTETVGNSVVGSGGRYEGAIDLSSSSGGVTVTVDRFWQNFPKSLRAQNGSLKIGLWPEFGNGPHYQGQYATPSSATPPIDPASLVDYRFEGGRWKTHRMVFDFHTGGPRATTAVATEATRAQTPLAGLVDQKYMRFTTAFHSFWTERIEWADALHTRYERFWDILVDDSKADSLSSIGKVGFPQFLARGGTNGGRLNWGWENFGDLSWVDGFCSLHYDLTESALSGFLRTGDYRFFSVGRDMATYRRDYGQNHSTNTSETWRGAQFYEKGWWHGSYTLGQYSHNWIAGLLLHYVLTGDEASREAAVENITFVLRDPPKNWSGYWGSRIPGWQINCLMDAYAYLGDDVYRIEAGAGVNRYKTLELAQGGNGYVLNMGANPPTTKAWMDNIFFIAAAKHAFLTQDFTHADLLDRMRNHFKATQLILPSGPPTAMVPAQVYSEWGPTTLGPKSIHLLWPMCEAFAWSALVFLDPGDVAWGQICFETVCRYWQSNASNTPLDFYDSNTWGKVTWKPGNWPGTESKAIANLMRWAPTYLATTRVLDGSWWY